MFRGFQSTRQCRCGSFLVGEEECRHGPLSCTAKSTTHRDCIPPLRLRRRPGLGSVGWMLFFFGSGQPAGEKRRCVTRAVKPAHLPPGSRPQAIGMGMLFNRHTVIARRQRRGYNTAHVAIHTQAAADANYVPGRPSPPLRVSGTFPVRTRVVSACHQTAIP